MEEILVWDDVNKKYLNNAGATISPISDPGRPNLVFIATDRGNGNPPAIPVMLHELIHRSGHVHPRVSDPGGHTVDGNVMRAGPRDQDTGLTSDQITYFRDHIICNDYFPK